MVKLANRIEALKMHEEDPENSDFPADATLAADQSRHFNQDASRANTGVGFDSHSSSAAATAAAAPAAEVGGSGSGGGDEGKRTLSKTIKGAIFREVVLAKVREMKEQEETLKVAGDAAKKA
jgi:calcium/calmodulin-dependent protein kinase I